MYSTSFGPLFSSEHALNFKFLCVPKTPPQINLTHYISILSFSQEIFMTGRPWVKITVSLRENQGFTLNPGSFVIFIPI